jgi:hypothetical protein
MLEKFLYRLAMAVVEILCNRLNRMEARRNHTAISKFYTYVENFEESRSGIVSRPFGDSLTKL